MYLIRCNNCKRLFSAFDHEYEKRGSSLYPHCRCVCLFPTGDPLADAVLSIDSGKECASIIGTKDEYYEIRSVPSFIRPWRISVSRDSWELWQTKFLASETYNRPGRKYKEGNFGSPEVAAWAALEWLFSKEGQQWSADNQ